MGIISSRTILQQGEYRKGEKYTGGKIQPIVTSDRLVCNELREEVQHLLRNEKPKAYNRISIVQVAPQSLQ
jgi:hypothetical protein